MNPETLLKAARLAHPEVKWDIEDSVDRKVICTRPFFDFPIYFNLESAASRYALWKALALKKVVIKPRLEDEHQIEGAVFWDFYGGPGVSAYKLYNTPEEAMMAAVAALEETK